MTDTVTTPSTAQTVAQTVAQTIAAVAPTVIAASAVANPTVATAMEAATIALALLQSAQQFTAAGGMTQAQLATLFAQIGAGVQASHTQWAAMSNPVVK